MLEDGHGIFLIPAVDIEERVVTTSRQMPGRLCKCEFPNGVWEFVTVV